MGRPDSGTGPCDIVGRGNLEAMEYRTRLGEAVGVRRSVLALVLAVILAMVAPGSAWAGKADVVLVEVVQEDADTWTFAVTVRHDDRNPDHWADWWRVRTVDGRDLGRRVLLHSHVGEQPFTRDERIQIPRDVRTVVVEAHDKVHGLGGATVTVDLSKPSGPNYRRRVP